MKKVCRDFTIVVSVPDDVAPEDCEIVITGAEASYQKDDETVQVDEEIIPGEPYEY